MIARFLAVMAIATVCACETKPKSEAPKIEGQWACDADRGAAHYRVTMTFDESGEYTYREDLTQPSSSFTEFAETKGKWQLSGSNLSLTTDSDTSFGHTESSALNLPTPAIELTEDSLKNVTALCTLSRQR
ncbi:MAG: hypothetical protein HOW73_29360 [Polyangiaceae bacterium]|nr:hypothetical protein [Polyangiaceae bacterium]